MTIHETDIDYFIYNVSGAAQAIIDFDCNIGYHLDRIVYQFPPAVRFLTQAYQLDRSAHWEILNDTDARLKKAKKKAEFHYRLDCLMEQIAPSFPLHPAVIDAIDSDNFIIRVIARSQLSDKKMFDIQSNIEQKFSAIATPLVIHCLNVINREHNV